MRHKHSKKSCRETMLMGMDPYGGRESAMRGTSGNSLIHVEFVRNKLKH